jgi:hypothetical protein
MNRKRKKGLSKMENLKKAIIEKSSEVDGVKKLSCAAAFVIAEKFDVKTSEIGKICNKESICICKCQLGCFA